MCQKHTLLSTLLRLEAMDTNVVAERSYSWRDQYLGGESRIVDPIHGCHIPNGSRSTSGYSYIKIQRDADGFSFRPKAYIVLMYVQGMLTSSSKLSELDVCSHTCGNGAAGCTSLEHISIERQTTNMRRLHAHCNKAAECPLCGHRFVVSRCTGHGDGTPLCHTPTVVNATPTLQQLDFELAKLHEMRSRLTDWSSLFFCYTSPHSFPLR